MSTHFSKKAAIIAGGALVGAGVLTVGAPIVVGALGFGASGITGGSTAAWLMSLHAGAVPAGGFVAVSQSIGATGAVAGTTKALGALAGGIAAARRILR